MTAQSGIIVADDDMMVRGVLRSVLMTSGHEVFMATSGEEAIGIALRMRAILVLLDLKMPRLNGLLTCERLRKLPGYATTPIAILTAYANEDARAAADRIGATLFILKPFQPAELLATWRPTWTANGQSGNVTDPKPRLRRRANTRSTAARECLPCAADSRRRGQRLAGALR